MSDVRKSKRKQSRLEALDLAYDLRQQMTAEILASFALSEKRLEKHLDTMVKGMGTKDQKDELKKTIAELELDKQLWLIKEERSEMLRLSRSIPQNIRRANSIFPMYITEWTERRRLLDLVLADCNAIQDELNYTARNILGDINKYKNIVKGYEKLFSLIKRLRQSDNRLIPKIKENEAKLRQ